MSSPNFIIFVNNDKIEGRIFQLKKHLLISLSRKSGGSYYIIENEVSEGGHSILNLKKVDAIFINEKRSRSSDFLVWYSMSCVHEIMQDELFDAVAD